MTESNKAAYGGIRKPNTVLECKSVCKRFGKNTVLHDVNISIPKGEIFGLAGPDGAGKTTFIRLAMGALKADSGEINILDSADLRTQRSKIGYLSQNFGLFHDLSIMENITLYGELYGVHSDDVASRARTLLLRTELWSFRDRFAGAISGGMKRKLALVIALLHRPELLFLDEPTSGVDPVAKREFWSILYDFKNEGITVLVATPYMDEAELCTRLAFLSGGKIIKEGTPKEIVENHPYELLRIEAYGKAVESVLSPLPFIREINLFGTCYHAEVDNADAVLPIIMEKLSSFGIDGIKISKIKPSMDDIFVSLITDKKEEYANA